MLFDASDGENLIYFLNFSILTILKMMLSWSDSQSIKTEHSKPTSRDV